MLAVAMTVDASKLEALAPPIKFPSFLMLFTIITFDFIGDKTLLVALHHLTALQLHITQVPTID